MIELNHEYTTQELAKEFGVSYNTFRRFREKYEKHLSLFYDFKITKKGPATLYIPIEQYGEFIPLKEYTKNKRNELIKQKAKAVIANNPR
jgi:transposase